MWSEYINRLKNKYSLKLLPPVSKNSIEEAVNSLCLSQDFIELYGVTNGLTFEWFRLLPIRDDSNVKSTWDSIQKANDTELSKFVVDEEFLERFVVFAEIGGGACAVFDKTDGSIWYEEDGDLNQTDLSLGEFIETCLREVSDL